MTSEVVGGQKQVFKKFEEMAKIFPEDKCMLNQKEVKSFQTGKTAFRGNFEDVTELLNPLMKVLGDEKHPTIGITGGEFNLFRERLQESEGVNTNFVNFLQSPECESTMEGKKRFLSALKVEIFFLTTKTLKKAFTFLCWPSRTIKEIE